MKTLIKSLAFVLSLAFAVPTTLLAETIPGSHSNTATTFKTGIYTTTKGLLAIALDKEKGTSVAIRLRGTDGRVLYTHHLNKKAQSYRSRLNLADLEDGNYIVEVTNGSETITQQVTIASPQPLATSRLLSIK